jgi:hypothetical protein
MRVRLVWNRAIPRRAYEGGHSGSLSVADSGQTVRSP